MRVFLTTIVIIGFAVLASAQTPEFGLQLSFLLDGNSTSHPSLRFGFDPTAIDSLEKKWYKELPAYPNGEEQLPPLGPGANEFRFTGHITERPELGTGSRIDIRHKPDSAAFQLTYEIQMSLTPEKQSASIVWTPSNIPANIRHIIIEPATIAPGPGRKKTDMKQVSQIDFPNRDSISKYQYMLLTIYYNRDYPPAGVHDQDVIDANLTLAANPAQDRLAASLRLDQPAKVRFLLLDVTGRILAEQTQYCDGLTRLEMDCRHVPAGAYKLVAVADNGEAYTKTVIIRK